MPITRPNGQTYHPRALANLADVKALRRLREAGVPVLLYGPPGTGRTSVIEAAFPDLITVAGDGDTTVGDLIGEYTQDEGGGYRFVYGPLVTAMQEGAGAAAGRRHPQFAQGPRRVVSGDGRPPPDPGQSS
jgi:nitric oxide reductase NorQ protein